MTLLKLLLLPTLATAHFTLNAPAAIGPFSEDTEGTGPCGGVSLAGSAMTNATNFHVGGEPIALFLGHPQGNWLFRGTLDTTAQANWTQIYPTFTQTGTGDYCQPAVAAPASWAGKMGILGVAMDGPDGLLYQCAMVNFVAGSGTYSTSTCKNGSSVTAAFASDTTLTQLTTKDASATNGTTTQSTSSTTSMAAGLVTPMSGLTGGLVALSLACLAVAGMM